MEWENLKELGGGRVKMIAFIACNSKRINKIAIKMKRKWEYVLIVRTIVEIKIQEK